MKNGENFKLLYDLADKFGAAGTYMECVRHVRQMSVCLLVSQLEHLELPLMQDLFLMICK